MLVKTILIIFLVNTLMIFNSIAQEMPNVYDVENRCESCPGPYLPSFDELPVVENLPDPFEWSHGESRLYNLHEWQFRRSEIEAEIEHYEIGEKPVRPDSIEASYSAGVLTVNITKNGNTLTLTSAVNLPDSGGPFPAVIGIGGGTGSLPSDIFTSRNIARITFNFGQVMAHTQTRGNEPINALYPDLIYIGAYSAWSWGISRLIDGLELVAADLPVDLSRLAVTGCSFAGKMALFAGAFDERIVLTIAQESGGGGAAAWRVSETVGDVETLARTNYAWFIQAMSQFSAAVPKLPTDHHELMAMVAPRALLVLGNPDYVWLADESGYVSCRAAHEVWKSLGVADRFGFSIVGGHNHCALPAGQRPEVEAFVDKFLLGDTSANTNVTISPYSSNLAPWITWDTPTFSDEPINFLWTSLVYPPDHEQGLDSSITFAWKGVNDAGKYLIQLSLDQNFTNIMISDSTTDTVTTINGLEKSKRYFWRIQVKSGPGSVALWSKSRDFTTFGPFPDKPQLVSVIPVPEVTRTVTFLWNSAEYSDEYELQVSGNENFTIPRNFSTTDTSIDVAGIRDGTQYYWRVRANNVMGPGPWSDVVDFIINLTDIRGENGIPAEYSLGQNYPNPFNPATKIMLELPLKAQTRVIVFDLLGREVMTLMNEELSAGTHEIIFEANNLPSGIYFYKVHSGDFVQVRKMILMK
jgi:hypothetical protein